MLAENLAAPFELELFARGASTKQLWATSRAFVVTAFQGRKPFNGFLSAMQAAAWHNAREAAVGRAHTSTVNPSYASIVPSGKRREASS